MIDFLDLKLLKWSLEPIFHNISSRSHLRSPKVKNHEKGSKRSNFSDIKRRQIINYIEALDHSTSTKVTNKEMMAERSNFYLYHGYTSKISSEKLRRLRQPTITTEARGWDVLVNLLPQAQRKAKEVFVDQPPYHFARNDLTT